MHDSDVFRTLRVTHATLLMQNGGTIRTMDNIGDSTQEVVMRHYTRTVQEHQRQVVNRMAVGMTSESKTPQHILGVQRRRSDSRFRRSDCWIWTRNSPRSSKPYNR